MKIAPNSHLVMIGDSVTDCGRARSIGAGNSEALGNGYVAAVDAWLTIVCPTHAVRVTNMGVSGNTIRDLAARWETDVQAFAPDWLSVMIGINDVWRQFDALRQAEAVLPAEFERTYDALMTRTRPQLQGLVLLTPYFIESSKCDPMRRRMDEYGAIVKRLAGKHAAICVDTQAAFDRALIDHGASVFSSDRVHPNHIGHLILARAFLEAVGLAWSMPDRKS